MQIVKKKNRRKAISPVLATVILIAITLIAAIAVAGFVFGLFGSFTSSATVSAQVTSCTTNAGDVQCTVNLIDSGTSNVLIQGCSINVGGKGVPSAATAGTGSLTVSAGATDTGVLCTSTGAQTEPAVGSQAVGSFSMSNGATVPFSATWS